MKKFINSILSLSIGVIIAFILAEVVLHIYNPFPSRIRGNEILLKANLSKTMVLDPPVPGLDTVFTHEVNELGFRGESWPTKPDERLKMIVVGGSTTECSMQSNEKTWPAKMKNRLKKAIPNVWVNNAGLDGCSTYGHIILMKDYIVDLKPDYALFLVGVNDRGKANFDHEDGFLAKRNESFVRTLLKKSELITIIDNLYKSYQAHAVQLGHHFNTTQDDVEEIAATTDSTVIASNTASRAEKLQFHEAYLPTYLARIDSITKLCTANNIVPVFITQPLLDGVTSTGWQVMELYNHALLDYCKKNNIFAIDLADAMPKEKALYYDNMHYTNKGADMVGSIVADSLITKLN